MIKPLENEKIKDVMVIWLKTNIAAHSFIPEKYWLENYHIVEKEYLPNSETFVYEEDNIIKGFISIINNLFIGALFLAEDYQGRGIGKKLIDYCKSLYSRLELCVYVENINAIKFYNHCGFIIRAEQPNSDSGFTEYLMSWPK